MFHSDANFHFVMKHFPEHEKILEKLYGKNESFRSLCEDFGDCVHSMEYWCGYKPPNDNASALCEEYKALYADLKSEIAKWLVEQKEED
jgi:hypothetical protein